MTVSDAVFVLKMFDHWNEKKPCYCGIPEVKFIYRNNIADPELYYKGEYYNVYDVEDVMYSDYIEYKEENPSYNGEFSDYMQEHTDDVLCLLEDYRLNRCEKIS